MVEFIVLEKKSDGKWEGHGTHSFKATPRVGEHIEMNDDDGIGQTYEVVAVVHPLEPTMTAGDLIIRHAGRSTDWRGSL